MSIQSDKCNLNLNFDSRLRETPFFLPFMYVLAVAIGSAMNILSVYYIMK